MTRLLDTELRKMFDTRAGFWLMASIGIAAVLASLATILFAPDSAQNYESYSTAIGFPIAVILPIVAILSVTGEWSQRTGLTTFTLVPSRGRVIAAKLIVILGVGIASMFVAMTIGALGNVLGATLNGVDIVWDISVGQLGLIVLANVLGMLIGFMLGVLMRNSAGAIVGYFVYSFMLPTIFGILWAFQDWFHDIHGWIDFQSAQMVLFDETPTGEQWAQLGVTGLVWLVIPTLIGLRLVMRSEVK
ncbi:ABC transporter permease [Nocardioides alcanivorans]|uniref:ABC transporter permease n=1 Tax=Nocardioides alcanivorans TaxID=2897352 RepID=UPI001F37C843|nr:ABC transporter permease [Nocardioides alcanivorans]